MAKRKQDKNDPLVPAVAAPTEATPEVPAAGVAEPSLRRFRVELQGFKPCEVEALGAEDAWLRFMTIQGITATDHRPAITEVA